VKLNQNLPQIVKIFFISLKSSQVKYIYMALFTIQIVSKHSINQDNITVFVYS